MKRISFKSSYILIFGVLCLFFGIQFILLDSLKSLKKVKESNQKALELQLYPNQVFSIIHLANYNFLQAQHFFDLYLLEHQTSDFEKYQFHINTTIQYLDTLSKEEKLLKTFKSTFTEKINLEKQLIDSQKELEQWVNQGISPIIEYEFDAYKIKKYDIERVLRTVEYDSIKLSNEVIKRGILARIGNAISGKYDIQKEELQVYMKVVLDQKPISGNFENQLKNVFISTDRFYTNQFNVFKNKIHKTQIKQKKLIQINHEIVNHCHSIFNFYKDFYTQNKEAHRKQIMEDVKKDFNKNEIYIYLLQGITLLFFIGIIGYLRLGKNQNI